MATIVTHAIVGVSLAYIFKPKHVPAFFYTSCMLLAMLPDIDVFGFLYGVNYADFWGHRGMTHSILFALIFAFAYLQLQQQVSSRFVLRRQYADTWSLLLVYALVMVSHGLLDMLTNGGLGVALFAPFENSRYFFPWHEVAVSPIGLHGWSMARIQHIAMSEFSYLILPAVSIAGMVWLLRYYKLAD